MHRKFRLVSVVVKYTKDSFAIHLAEGTDEVKEDVQVFIVMCERIWMYRFQKLFQSRGLLILLFEIKYVVNDILKQYMCQTVDNTLVFHLALKSPYIRDCNSNCVKRWTRQ